MSVGDWKLDRMLEDGEWESGGIADCGLRIADCGLRIDKTFNLDFESAVEQTHKSAIRNPHSPIPIPHSLLAFMDAPAEARAYSLA